MQLQLSEDQTHVFLIPDDNNEYMDFCQKIKNFGLSSYVQVDGLNRQFQVLYENKNNLAEKMQHPNMSKYHTIANFIKNIAKRPVLANVPLPPIQDQPKPPSNVYQTQRLQGQIQNSVPPYGSLPIYQRQQPGFNYPSGDVNQNYESTSFDPENLYGFFQHSQSPFITEPSFSLPDNLRSLTAEYVNNRKIQPNQTDIDLLVSERQRLAPLRKNWLEAVKAFYFADYSNRSAASIHTGVQKGAEKNLYKQNRDYENALLNMAENIHIWNCGELADFALICMIEQRVLKPDYIPGIACLNNRKVPDTEYYQYFQGQLNVEKNHDHVFAVILNSEKNIKYIIDLWCSFLERKEQFKFIVTLDEFINLLNENMDGLYVNAPVGVDDFKIISLLGDPQNASNPQYGNVKAYDPLTKEEHAPAFC